MASRKHRESDHYQPVENFLKRRFGCFVTDQNRGTKFGRVDVIGIRDIGGNLSGEIEVIGVEVKNGNQPFNTATGQAFGYSVYAERCYLADVRNSQVPFELEEIDIASKLGVGLLAIKPNGTVVEVLTSPQHIPLPKVRAQLINTIGYSMCVFCGSVFERSDNDYQFKNAKRTLEKAYEEEKGFVYWLEEVNKRRKPAPKHNRVKRYVCSDCVQGLYGEIFDKLTEE